jgi:hypothetical protein
MTEGTDAQKRKHIVEMVQDFASEYAENVFAHIDRMINVNVDMEIEEPRRRRRKRMKEKAESAKQITGSTCAPSVVQVDAPQITDSEVKDFVKIDLNLIDKKRYFDKFFRISKS